MEHNAPSLLSLPQEIKELIFNLGLSVVDLLQLRSVCKALLTSLSNQKLWKATCIREFDLEFIDENSNWIELASKYGAINYNIRKARVLVQALAVNTTNNNRLYTGESFVFDDNKIVVNWLRTDGHGSSSLDYSDHSAIVDITTRKEAHQIRLKKDRSLIVIGDKLAQLDWNSYNVKPYFTNVKLSDSGQTDTFDNAIPTNRNTRTILSNSDPDQKYIVVIVDGTPNTLGTNTDIVMRAYDLYEESVVKSFAIKNFAKSGYYYSNPNVILHGDFIYAWQEETNTLHVFNLTSGRDEGDQHQVSFGKETGFLLGAHKSVVFGAINSSTDTAPGMWFYDLGTKKTRTLRDSIFRTIKSMIVHCGVLVVECGQYMYFVDYLSDPNQLKLISTLQLDQVYRTSLQPMQDGKLFLSGYNSGAKLIDFEHANDNCEILFVTKSATSKGETKYTQISLKAYELVSRAKELLGTHEYVSRYFKMNAEQRFGIIYAKNQVRKNQALKLADTFSLATQKNPEYNTPYMYHRMTLGADEEKPRIVWVIPPPIKEFFGEVILFYEEFDGTQWKLSKPRHWAEYIK